MNFEELIKQHEKLKDERKRALDALIVDDVSFPKMYPNHDLPQLIEELKKDFKEQLYEERAGDDW